MYALVGFDQPHRDPEMQRFIGRQKELATLEEAYASDKVEFIPIYGRRRVGKSELILQFIRDKPALYFLGKNAPATFQVREFLSAAARGLDHDLLAHMAPADWKTILGKTLEYRDKERKLVLVFDEFQWTAQASPELPSVLQEFIDLDWRRSGDILLILCGSCMGFMEREVLGRKSPLFGRRTAQIMLQPFSYQEAALFHPSYSIEDQARTYFICGGIPFYLQFFSAQRSIMMNIQANFLDESAALFREVDFLLREELRELEKYYGILTALAAGSLRSSQIADETGIPERNLYYYLQQLVELGYLRRRHPLTGGRVARRVVRFALHDPLLRFYFRFVYPNLSFIMQMKADRSYRDLMQPQLESYFGTCFEHLCREALPVLYEREGVNSAFEVGEYWDKQTQIDVVGVRRDGLIDLGECKWGSVRSIPRVCEELTQKATAYPNRQNSTIGKRIFTRRRVRASNQREGFRFHCLEDIYA